MMPPEDTAPAASGCTTVAALGTISSEFTLEPDPLEADRHAITAMLSGLHPPADANAQARSLVGAAVLQRCGAHRPELARVLVRMSSSRGAIEWLVAHTSEPLGPPHDALAERAFGPVAPRAQLGRPIEPGPLADRLARAERRALGEGAFKRARVTMQASDAGTGQFTLRLSEGCHRLELFGEVPTHLPRRATDLDAEVREASSGRMLVRDRSDAADSRLEFCLGETAEVHVPFEGAAGQVAVVIEDSVWQIPTMIPAHWGSRARAGFAAALRRKRSPEPRSQPIVQSLGIQGVTSIPFEIEPGRCYLAAMALVRGDVRAIRLSAAVGERYLQDAAVDATDGAALAFCSEVEEHAVFKVEVRSASAWWALSLWPIGSISP